MLRMHNRQMKFPEFSAQVHEYALQGKKWANQAYLLLPVMGKKIETIFSLPEKRVWR